MMHGPVNHNIDFPFQNKEILLHDIVVMRLEILPWLELHHCKIHSWAFHQVFWAAVAKAVLFFTFIYYKHPTISSYSMTLVLSFWFYDLGSVILVL